MSVMSKGAYGRLIEKSEKLKCPACGSPAVQAVAQHKKKLSISKGIVGGALLGPLGAVAGGTILGKKGKATFHCTQCGEVWRQKL